MYGEKAALKAPINSCVTLKDVLWSSVKRLTAILRKFCIFLVRPNLEDAYILSAARARVQLSSPETRASVVSPRNGTSLPRFLTVSKQTAQSYRNRVSNVSATIVANQPLPGPKICLPFYYTRVPINLACARGMHWCRISHNREQPGRRAANERVACLRVFMCVMNKIEGSQHRDTRETKERAGEGGPDERMQASPVLWLPRSFCSGLSTLSSLGGGGLSVLFV